MDRPRCFWRPSRQSTHRGGHIFYEPELRAATLAPIPDLHWLQPRCLLAQRFRQLSASLRDEGGFRVVDNWIRHHLYHSPGMLVSRLRQWQICFCNFYKWYAYFRTISFLLSISECWEAFWCQEHNSGVQPQVPRQCTLKASADGMLRSIFLALKKHS